MAKYRKRPVIIEAFQYYVGTPDEPIFGEWPQWAKDELMHNSDGLRVARDNCPRRIEAFPGYLAIHTLEGIMIAQNGDWIIWDFNGIHPCKPDVFTRTYEPA